MNVSDADFQELVRDALPRVRAVVRRIIGDPDDTEDVVQDALLKAHARRASFRGEAEFPTWLCSIAVRSALDHLRTRKRWRARAQLVYAARCLDEDAIGAEVGAVLQSAEHAFDVREHVAYCFACVGRSLPEDEHAAVVLRDLFGMTNREAARMVGTSESILRHRLASGRQAMQAIFDSLCALVGKGGACHQCRGLREGTTADRRGPTLPVLSDFENRVAMARNADLDGSSKRLHDVFFGRTAEQERKGLGDAEATTECGTG